MNHYTPANNPLIFGVDTLKTQLNKWCNFQSIILSGPKGVGKMTFAYHAARALFQGEKGNFEVNPYSSLFARVSSGAHGDLKVIKRERNALGQKTRDIIIESIREMVHFLHSTSLEGGWRIVIIDSIDELNFKSSNALLKIVEEPPRHSLIILISHCFGRILPSLKSRCAHYKIMSLNDQEMRKTMVHLLPHMTNIEHEFLIKCAEGCPGRALKMFQLGGKIFYLEFLKMIEGLNNNNLKASFSFLDKYVALKDVKNEDEPILAEFFLWWLGRAITSAVNHEEIIRGERTIFLTLLNKHPITFWHNFWFHAIRTLYQMEKFSWESQQVWTCLFTDMMRGQISYELSNQRN